MTYEALHHALTVVLQAVAQPHPIGSAPQGSGDHPNLNGCVNSPEAATDILMAFGAAGLYYGTALARRFSRRKRSDG